MTKYVPIMPDLGHEPPKNTRISLAFCDVLKALKAFTIAERDLEDIAHSQDPAYSMWAADTERAFEHLADALGKVHCLPLEICEDIPLKRMTLLIDTMIGHEEPGGARALQFEMQLMFFTKLQAAGLSPTAIHRNGLLIHGRHLVNAMLCLPLFDGAPVDDASSGDCATDKLTFDF
ncbi:hypothetical protein KDD17_02570 [Sulfitobacter albidus]|uniref:Uncharacterized protein n=1 Tax=Sulfitobacter albidus TaxID=2829501 RepID=A0A975PMM2_9RHOB|nr:hypothetical protein [Sulfitobacter albidus]QUJ76953.1 hypothetical protein KDD17_02570 [Sulfitobacter albidus]